MPQFNFSQNEKGELAAELAKDGDDFAPALAKAFGNQLTEVVSERSGGALAFIPAPQKLKMLKAGLMKRWFDVNPVRLQEHLRSLSERQDGME